MYYQFADLLLRSDLPLAELPVARPGLAECRVHSGPSEDRTAFEDRWDHHWRSPEGGISLSCARDGDAYRIGMTGLGTFLVEDGGEAITCPAVETLPGGTLEHLLLDQVLPRVLAHRGRLVLHAGCVVTPAGAIGFLGDSGAGKSTLCASFSRAGFPLMGDDGVVVRETAPTGFEVLATYPGLRLLPDALGPLFDGEPGDTPVAHYSAKRRLDRNHAELSLAAGPRPLRALYLLDAGLKIGIQPVGRRAAFMALLGAAFQLHLDDRDRSRELFERVSALSDAVPMRRLSYPRSFSQLDAVRDALLADAAELPPLARAGG